MKRHPATRAAAIRFQHDSASASDPIDTALVVEFCAFLGIEPTEENKTKAKRAIERSRED